MDRSHPSALEVDEFHFPRGCEHDVPALEVPVLEVPGTAHQQPVAQPDQVLLQRHLVELHAGGLEEAVFEIVEVEHHACPVEAGYRAALREVQSLGSDILEGRQGLHRCPQQGLLLRTVFSAPASCRHGIEKSSVSQVLLQVGHPVTAHGQHFRHGQSQPGEMPVEVEERSVFPQACPGCGYAAASVPADPEILTVASRGGEGGDAVLPDSRVPLEERTYPFHSDGKCRKIIGGKQKSPIFALLWTEKG